MAAPNGTFYQDIDNDGKPFAVTALAAPVKDGAPFSGYDAAYVQDGSNNWQQVDPGSCGNR